MDVHEDGNLRVTKFGDLGSYGNNAYIIADMSANEALIVDMPMGSQALLDGLGGLNVKAILLTHTHHDHWNEYDLVKTTADAPVRCHAAEQIMPADKNDAPVADGEEIAVGGQTVRAIYTPGHTPGSTCYLVGGYLLSGDTLFPGGPGRTGSNADLLQSIESITTKLYRLADEIAVFPGHGDDTTIGASKAEYEVFAAREHPDDLHGDVTWAS